MLTAACCCILTSCGGSGVVYPDDLQIFAEKDSIGYEGEDVTVVIYYNGTSKWKINCHVYDEDGNELPNNSIKISPTSGRKDKNIKVSIPENNSSKKIKIVVEVEIHTHNNWGSRATVITQEGNPNVDDE